MDYGIGTDTYHFHCGFTSVKLLQQLAMDNNSIFHDDCTHKIIKYNYPLMVFGFSDLAHKFHPIAFNDRERKFKAADWKNSLFVLVRWEKERPALCFGIIKFNADMTTEAQHRNVI